MLDPAPWFETTPEGLRLRVKLTPKASANRLQGIEEGPDGLRLKAQVTAVPEGGKANAALIKLLAKHWGVPKTRLKVVSGATSREKVLMLDGDVDQLLQTLKDRSPG